MTGRNTAAMAAILGLLLLATLWRLRGPAPQPLDAPPEEFSAARAIDVLGELLHENVPHPVGTPANRLIRQRIESRFRQLGFATEIQRDFVCNATPACATVENVIATTPRDSGPYVLLAAHYDSAGAAPGASDDGVGVAALLEVARALGPVPGVAYLITDGEEAGLLGAELFVKTEWPKRVSVVLNAENRGTSGPAFLFETSRGNAGLMPAVRAIDRPYASSLFYTIYELLPNDTDVTVFKRAGMQAMNFAAIGSVEHYHTPLDNLANVSPRTVQHHGDNLLSATRALQRDVYRTPHNAVFFDILGFGIVSWRQSWTMWIALASLLMLLAGSRGASWRSVAAGIAMTLIAVAAAAVIAFAVSAIAHLRAGGAARLAYPGPVIVAMWMSGIAAAVLTFVPARRFDRGSLYAGVALVWHVAAFALAWTLPGTAYLFLVPAVAFAVCAIFRARPLVAALAPSIAAGIVLFPLTAFLYPALGRTSLVPIAVVVALIITTFVPLLDLRAVRVAAAAVVIAVVCAGLTMFLPVYTESHPRRHSIDHELTPRTIRATAERNGEIVTVRVSSSRAADRVMLDFDRRVDVIRVNGVAPAPRNPRRIWRGGVTVYGREAVVEVRARDQVTATASDLTYGLPAAARDAAARRDASAAVPSYRGDVTISRSRLTI